MSETNNTSSSPIDKLFVQNENNTKEVYEDDLILIPDHKIPKTIVNRLDFTNKKVDSKNTNPDIRNSESRSIDNEYYNLQIKALRADNAEEKVRNNRRLNLIKAREDSRKGSRDFVGIGIGNNPKLGLAEKYKAWSGKTTGNSKFGKLYVELDSSVAKIYMASRFEATSTDYLKDLGKTVSNAAYRAGREAVTNLGMTVAAGISDIENNSLNSLSMATDKALAPLLNPVVGTFKEVKNLVYNGIGEATKAINDWVNGILGINQDTIQFKKESIEKYYYYLRSTNPKLQSVEQYKYQTVEEYKKAMAEYVLNAAKYGHYGELSKSLGEIFSNDVGTYGALSASKGQVLGGDSLKYGGLSQTLGESYKEGSYGNLESSHGDKYENGANYKEMDTGVLAKIIETYFVKPLMDTSNFKTEKEKIVEPITNRNSSDNASYLESEKLNNDASKSTLDYTNSATVSIESNKVSNTYTEGADPLNKLGESPDTVADILDWIERTPTYLENTESHTSEGSEYYFIRALQEAAKDANAIAWEAAESLCKNGRPMLDKKVMALMDSTTSRYNVLLMATSLFEKSTLGQETMEAINTHKPSQLINRFMLSQDATNGAQGEIISELLANEALMDAANTSAIKGKLRDADSPNSQYYPGNSNNGIGLIRDLMPKGIGGSIEQKVKEVLSGNEYFLTSPDPANETIVDDYGMVNLMKGLMDYSEKDANQNYFDKLSNIHGIGTLAPRPIWHSIQESTNSGKKELFGMNNLVSMFRVNKNFPAGEIDYFQNGMYHLFFVKPDLNLTQNAVSLMGYYNHPLIGEIITQLNYNNVKLSQSWGEGDFPTPMYTHRGAHPYFSYILSNLVKGTSIPDLQLDTKEGWENTFGGRTQFGLTTRKSYIGNDFSINFYDTKELLVMNTITAWMKYIEIMKEGQGECERKTNTRGCIDYMGALYYFVMEPDNHTLAHWGRYVGIFPTSAPWSSVRLEGGNQDIPEFTVNFKSQYHESNDPNILMDFNYIMRLPEYTPSTDSNPFVKYPILASINPSEGRHGTSDPNLLGGPTRSENRAYIRMTPDYTSANGADKNKEDGWKSASASPFKFLLEFESNMEDIDAAPSLREKANEAPISTTAPILDLQTRYDSVQSEDKREYTIDVTKVAYAILVPSIFAAKGNVIRYNISTTGKSTMNANDAEKRAKSNQIAYAGNCKVYYLDEDLNILSSGYGSGRTLADIGYNITQQVQPGNTLVMHNGIVDAWYGKTFLVVNNVNDYKADAKGTIDTSKTDRQEKYDKISDALKDYGISDTGDFQSYSLAFDESLWEQKDNLNLTMPNNDVNQVKSPSTGKPEPKKSSKQKKKK